MTTENENTMPEALTTDAPVIPVVKHRGRPKGSKNGIRKERKPRVAITPVAPVETVETQPTIPPAPPKVTTVEPPPAPPVQMVTGSQLVADALTSIAKQMEIDNGLKTKLIDKLDEMMAKFVEMRMPKEGDA